MSDTDKVKGPASYFPSIEKKYGKPIAHWTEIVRAEAGKPHMQIVSLLKEALGLGHGHANAIVAYVLAEKSSKGEA